MLLRVPSRSRRAPLIHGRRAVVVAAALVATSLIASAPASADPTPTVTPRPTCVPTIDPTLPPTDVTASNITTGDMTSLGDLGKASAKISWTAPVLGACDTVIDHYTVTAVATSSVLAGAATPASPAPVTTTGTSIDLTGLFGSTNYSITVESDSQYSGILAGKSAPITITTPHAGFPPPTYTGPLTGSVTLKTLTKGAVQLSGSATASAKGTAFTGGFTFLPTTASLRALGFLPVTANVSLVPTEVATGTLVDGLLSASLKVRIKVPSIKVFGVAIGGGATCQAAQLSTIQLQSVGSYAVATGGNLAGTFSISNLTGCGALNGIVSPLTAGSGNAITLQLGAGVPQPQI